MRIGGSGQSDWSRTKLLRNRKHNERREAAGKDEEKEKTTGLSKDLLLASADALLATARVAASNVLRADGGRDGGSSAVNSRITDPNNKELLSC